MAPQLIAQLMHHELREVVSWRSGLVRLLHVAALTHMA